MTKMTILYENHESPNNKSLEIGWGLSIFIEIDNKKILFDSGWNGDILLRNCQRLNIDLSSVDAFIISHPHWDHMGGVPQVIPRLKNAVVYFPEEFSSNQITEIKRMNPSLTIKINKIGSILEEVSQNLALTSTVLGEMNIKEEALIIKNKDGTGTLVVGCLHPGLERFVQDAESFAPISSIVGGLHGFKNFTFLESRKISKCFVGHCTKQIAEFKINPHLKTQELFVGMQIEL